MFLDKRWPPSGSPGYKKMKTGIVSLISYVLRILFYQSVAHSSLIVLRITTDHAVKLSAEN